MRERALNTITRVLSAGALAAVLGSSLVVAAPSSAEATELAAAQGSISKCDPDRVCFFTGANYTGTKFTLRASNVPFCTRRPIPSRSAINRTTIDVKMWSTYSCSSGGTSSVLGPGSARPTIGHDVNSIGRR